MSELDADLYGGRQRSILFPPANSDTFADLYGNDESEFAVPTEPEEPVKEEELEETVKLESPTVSSYTQVNALAEEQKPSIGASPPSSHQQNHSATSSTAQSIPTSYTSEQTTQQIPTYQERQDTADLSPMNHGSTSYAGQVDRPVRPSEMKEEG